jgi:hypothetical protein
MVSTHVWSPSPFITVTAPLFCVVEQGTQVVAVGIISNLFGLICSPHPLQ